MEPLNKLEKALNSFPKDLAMDQESKNKIYQAITHKSRKHMRVKTPVKVWLVGLSIIALACMLFLPSILRNQSSNTNKNATIGQTNKPNKSVGQTNKSNKPDDHPATHLGIVKQIQIEKDGSKKMITDPMLLKKITNEIAASTYFGKTDKVKDDGSDYILTFTVEDGSFYEFQLRTNQKPNLFDIQKQEWRQSDTLQSVLTPLLPGKILNELEIRSIVQKLYPSGHFDTEYGARLADSKDLGLPGNQVWIAEGTTSNEERIKVYLDPKNGSVIKEEPLVSTHGVSTIVESFFKDVANKNATDAWNYIHSKAKKPNSAVKETDIQKNFINYVAKSTNKLKRIEQIKWELVWAKNPDCMCTIEDSVIAYVVMSDGSTKRIHVLLDADHKWKLYYSSSKNDLD
jgi:hypothetical protein